MYFIKSTPSENGNHGNPTSRKSEGMIGLPDSFLKDYIDAKGFVYITISNDVVTEVTINQEAYNAFMTKDEKKQREKWRATKTYEPGDFLTVDDKYYKVLLMIFAGSYITPGTNVIETTMDAEIAKLNKEED